MNVFEKYTEDFDKPWNIKDVIKNDKKWVNSEIKKLNAEIDSQFKIPSFVDEVIKTLPALQGGMTPSDSKLFKALRIAREVVRARPSTNKTYNESRHKIIVSWVRQNSDKIDGVLREGRDKLQPIRDEIVKRCYKLGATMVFTNDQERRIALGRMSSALNTRVGPMFERFIHAQTMLRIVTEKSLPWPPNE